MSWKTRTTTAALCISAALAACNASRKATAPPAPAAAPQPPLGGVVGQNVVTSTATVKEINQKTRRVTLRRQDGSLLKFTASDQVRNLDKVKVGDQVTVTYYESLAYEVKKPGQGGPAVAVTEGIERAKPGEKPGGTAGRVTTMTATIASIDKPAQTVTLRNPDGELATFKARYPENLDRVAVGDLVEITYTEALAISVDTPTKE